MLVRNFRIVAVGLFVSAIFCSAEIANAAAAAVKAQAPDDVCRTNAKECLALAIDAMGGKDRLQAVKSFRIDAAQHTALVEQSYRQDPFITSYARFKQIDDVTGRRVRVDTHMIWPEADPGQFESDATLVVGDAGAVMRAGGHDVPASLADAESARFDLKLSPLQLLLTALHAPELRLMSPEMLRSTQHVILAFNWNDKPIRILINPFNHLPDAIETVSTFSDHWYQWGDVRQRIYWDDWQVFHGIVYPLNQVEERNGILWESTQVIALDFNVPIDEADFKLDTDVAKKSSQSKGWESSFTAKNSTLLAPGITLYPGSWNATLVQQDDGIVLLEAPLSGTYIGGVLEKTKEQYPNSPVKAVLSTSDSWPHIGGVRQTVALGLPVYILDLNQPILDRLVAAPHTLHPDLLARSPHKPVWRLVSGKVDVGKGANRMELYPLRGASTERQYVVYFPEHELLYASDTLALNADGSLYNPELMREVVAAVRRENLQVKTVFAMHQGPVPWTQVTSLVEKSLN
jgi:hypothetical protein